MKNEIIYSYEPLWGEWKVEEVIGKGSVGNVYKVSREFFGKKQYSAVKVISIPTEEQYNMYVSSSGHTESSKEFFEDLAKQIAKEINLLYDLKGHSNIIAYEDHMVKNIDDKWHIFIRMEFAQCLSDNFKDREVKVEEVIKLGIDMSKALEFCHEKGIMHRDIKEGNIFVSLNSNAYKLGDFSVSKEANNLTMAQTKVGTLNYMPPEIINGRPYNKSVDLYSLGLVLYKYLNKGRLPFLPEYPTPISFMDIEQAYIKRLRSDHIKPPVDAPKELADIVLKACSHSSNDRYSSVTEFRKALENMNKNINLDKGNSLSENSNQFEETVAAGTTSNKAINQYKSDNNLNNLNTNQNNNANSYNNSGNFNNKYNRIDRNMNNNDMDDNKRNYANNYKKGNELKIILIVIACIGFVGLLIIGGIIVSIAANNDDPEPITTKVVENTEKPDEGKEKVTDEDENKDKTKETSLTLEEAMAYSNDGVKDEKYKTAKFGELEFQYPEDSEVEFFIYKDDDYETVTLKDGENVDDYESKVDDDISNLYISQKDSFTEYFSLRKVTYGTAKENATIYEDKNKEREIFYNDETNLNDSDDWLLYYSQLDERYDDKPDLIMEYNIQTSKKVYCFSTMGTEGNVGVDIQFDYLRYVINSLKID